MGIKRAVYELVNISDDQVYEWVCFSKARYMTGVGLEILARTPVPQLSRSYQHLIRVCTVYMNYRKLRVKRKGLKSPFRTIFPAYTQRQCTHQCCQYFDFFFALGGLCSMMVAFPGRRHA